MITQIELGELKLDVVLKNIKNIHLRVYPPAGRVRISAPRRIDINTLRSFAISKLDWIKEQQKKLQEQARETPREYLDQEIHYVWGKCYRLKLMEQVAAPSVELQHDWMLLWMRPGADQWKKRAVVETWYREQIKQAVPPLLAKWEPLMGVKVARFFVQRMKTRWGSCNYVAHHIRLNTDLARKPCECLEYIVVHEMVHLLEPSHNAHFFALMDRFLPQWRLYREQLNQLPVSDQK